MPWLHTVPCPTQWVGAVLVLLVLSAHWACRVAGGSREGWAGLILNHSSVCFNNFSVFAVSWFCCPLRSARSFSEHVMEHFLFLFVCIF